MRTVLAGEALGIQVQGGRSPLYNVDILEAAARMQQQSCGCWGCPEKLLDSHLAPEAKSPLSVESSWGLTQVGRRGVRETQRRVRTLGSLYEAVQLAQPAGKPSVEP